MKLAVTIVAIALRSRDHTDRYSLSCGIERKNAKYGGELKELTTMKGFRYYTYFTCISHH